MNRDLRESYRQCRREAQRARSNFYLSFLLLPAPKRRAMCALYAFYRRTDDIVDQDLPLADRGEQLDRWRAALDAAVAGEFRDPILPAVADTLRRRQIPPALLHHTIDGAARDLTTPRYETFAELEQYCFQVAGAVGLSCIRVWGHHGGEEADRLAVTCGEAFQLTNILRDLKEDAARGRVYLPLDELAAHHYSVEKLLRGERDRAFSKLMQRQIHRVEQLYEQAQPLEAMLEPAGARVLRLMTATYRGLLKKIERCGGDVFSRRVRHSRWTKLRLAAASLRR